MLHIRKPSLPDPEQALLYKHLRIALEIRLPSNQNLRKSLTIL